MTDPDPNNLKPAAAYLLQVARTTTGDRRNRRGAKIDALRQRKDEILEAYRGGLNIQRVAQIFRERNVDISTQHLMRAIRLFIKEGEGEVELAGERRRAQQAGSQKGSSSGTGRSEKQRSGRSR